MKKAKGFNWSGFIQPMINKAEVPGMVYAGNFFMELRLPNALKLNSMIKLRDRLEKYVESHGGEQPKQITVNKRQRQEYIDIFPKVNRNFVVNEFSMIITYNGIPLKIR